MWGSQEDFFNAAGAVAGAYGDRLTECAQSQWDQRLAHLGGRSFQERRFSRRITEAAASAWVDAVRPKVRLLCERAVREWKAAPCVFSKINGRRGGTAEPREGTGEHNKSEAGWEGG